MAATGAPPLLQLRPGAVFWARVKGRGWCTEPSTATIYDASPQHHPNYSLAPAQLLSCICIVRWPVEVGRVSDADSYSVVFFGRG